MQTPSDSQRQIDRLCDEFETAFKAGEQPALEQYLERVEESVRGELFRDLLPLELELRVGIGELPQRAEYRPRFPQYSETVEEALLEFEDERAGLDLPDSSLASDVLLQHLSDIKLMTPEELDLWLKTKDNERLRADSKALARQLVADGKITPYQARSLLKGERERLLVDKYLILDSLDAGGMGIVFKALHRPMSRIVALKMLAPQLVNSPDKIKRFRREVRVAASLTHPNIVTAHDADESKGIHFLVMEFVQGRDLRKIVEANGPLPVPETVDYVRQAAHGLAHAHQQGVIHRDIKPSNLMLSDAGVIKVLDLGLARMDEGLQFVEHELSTNATDPGAAQTKDHLTHAGALMGTVAYMAPEQALDTHGVDQRADIYSLGCTLYYLLIGEPPYRGENPMQIVIGHREAPIPLLRASRPDVPEGLEAIGRKMLSKQPVDRPQSMMEVIAALEGLDIVMPPTRRRPRSMPEVRAAASSDSGLTTILGQRESRETHRSRRWQWIGLATVLACALILWFERGRFVAKRPPTPIDIGAQPPVPVVDDGELLRTPIPDGEPGLVFQLQATDKLGLVIFSPDGKYLAVGPRAGATRERAVRLYDLQTRELDQYVPRAKWDECFVFYPRGDRLLVIEDADDCAVIDCETGESKRMPIRLSADERERGASLIRPCVAPDARSIIAELIPRRDGFFDCQTVVFDALSGREMSRIPDCEAIERHFRMSPDGTLLLGINHGDPDFPLAVWDAATGKVLHGLDNERRSRPASAVFSSDSQFIAAVTYADNSRDSDSQVHIWRTNSGEVERRINADAGKVHYVRFLGSSHMLAGGGTDGTIRIWDAESGRELFQLETPESDNRYFDVSPCGRFAATHSVIADIVNIYRLPTLKWLEQRAAELPPQSDQPPTDDPAILALLGLSDEWEWSEPENLGDAVNSSVDDFEPHRSTDQLRLYFSSSRSEGNGGADLWFCRRDSLTGEFLHPENLGSKLNSDLNEESPTLSADELTIVFGRHDGNVLSSDLWMSTRSSVDEPFAEPTPLADLNCDSHDGAPALSPDGLTLVFSSTRGGGYDLYMCRRETAAENFGPVVRLSDSVNSPGMDSSPMLALDGRALLFRSDSAGANTNLWLSTWSEEHQTFDGRWELPSRIQSATFEGGPCLSDDGHQLYFHTRRPGGFGGKDLYCCRLVRRAPPPTDDPAILALLGYSDEWEWSEPENLGPIVNTPFEDGTPTLSRDGLTLLFESNREGGQGLNDIWMSTRDSVEAGFSKPRNLSPTVNSQIAEHSPSLSADGLILTFSSRRAGGSGGVDLYQSTRPSVNEPFAAAITLGPTVNSNHLDDDGCLSPDGQVLVFASDRPGGNGGRDLWMSTRDSPGESFGIPVNLGAAVNSSADEVAPQFLPDGRGILFSSNRIGGAGGFDFYVSFRDSRTGTYGRPFHVSQPINSQTRELEGTFTADARQFIFSSWLRRDDEQEQGLHDVWISRLVRKKPSAE